MTAMTMTNRAPGEDVFAMHLARGTAMKRYPRRDTVSMKRGLILNVASSGKSSTDRTMADYTREIWQAARVPVTDQLSLDSDQSMTVR